MTRWFHLFIFFVLWYVLFFLYRQYESRYHSVAEWCVSCLENVRHPETCAVKIFLYFWINLYACFMYCFRLYLQWSRDFPRSSKIAISTSISISRTDIPFVFVSIMEIRGIFKKIILSAMVRAQVWLKHGRTKILRENYIIYQVDRGVEAKTYKCLFLLSIRQNRRLLLLTAILPTLWIRA